MCIPIGDFEQSDTESVRLSMCLQLFFNPGNFYILNILRLKSEGTFVNFVSYV